MKKKYFKCSQVILGIALLIVMPNKVFAECDYKTQNELKTSAAHVEAKYLMNSVITDYNGVEHPEISEELARTRDSGYMISTYVTLNITNITDNLYFAIENVEDNIKEMHYANELVNNLYQMKVPDTNKIREYKITIYSNHQDCLDEEIRTITIKTPKFNDLSSLHACENSDKYYCQEYITEEPNITEEEIVNKYNLEHASKEEKKEENKVMKTITWIVSILLILLVVGIGMMFYQKKKGKKQV